MTLSAGFSTLSGTSRIAGVMGWPLAHSRSPRIHGIWLRRHGIDGGYVPLPVAPDRLAAAVRGLPALGLRGANVTLPHKEAVLPLVDEVSAAAQAIGAANTLTVLEDGGISADNTDGTGFLRHLVQSAPAWTPSAAPALVLGAGGAARAVVYTLIDAGVPTVWIENRTVGRAEALAADMGPTARPVPPGRLTELLPGIGLLVNATTTGMAGQPALSLSCAPLPGHAIVYDLVYNPLETALLAEAQHCGLIAVNGLGMLLHQAAPGFERWFGVRPVVDREIHETIAASLIETGSCILSV